jgi:hypothetical protein
VPCLLVGELFAERLSSESSAKLFIGETRRVGVSFDSAAFLRSLKSRDIWFKSAR